MNINELVDLVLKEIEENKNLEQKQKEIKTGIRNCKLRVQFREVELVKLKITQSSTPSFQIIVQSIFYYLVTKLQLLEYSRLENLKAKLLYKPKKS